MDDQFKKQGAIQGAQGDLAEFLASLKVEGCNNSVVGSVLERIRAERAAAAAEAARVFFNGAASEPISLLELADRMRELRCQSLTLELAILGACKEAKIDGCGEALAQQASELSRGMERLEKAFNAELQLLAKRGT